MTKESKEREGSAVELTRHKRKVGGIVYEGWLQKKEMGKNERGKNNVQATK